LRAVRELVQGKKYRKSGGEGSILDDKQSKARKDLKRKALARIKKIPLRADREKSQKRERGSITRKAYEGLAGGKGLKLETKGDFSE